uniref:Cytochrome b5 heme-binding domain-containing protein n=1 Tax=Calcidiscus leptoporus TaxID=127549 RepID=A0A7S0JKE6_9EUKA|mmetsp:Transcript_749/g.1728  ORF Transcript_749/g.1728 Transcript_749/m.1728 type:complete len:272 (+) Transcript_749:116-931(+)
MATLRQRHVANNNETPSARGSAANTPSKTRSGGCLLSCCKGCAKFVLVLIVLFAGALVMDAVSKGRSLDAKGLLQPFDVVNFFFMKLARDLSRVKARKRRFGQKDALMPVLLGKEAPLPLGDPDAGIALTLEELAEYDGRELPGTNGHSPLFLAIRGRIYDVTAGAAFYGPGRSYHKLVGKDATRAFCTGCLEPDCLISSVEGLTDSQQKEAERWIELYEHHDKYKLVGRVRVPLSLSAEDDEELAEVGAQEVELALEAESRKTYKPFKLR